jgi:hypothetical protein
MDLEDIIKEDEASKPWKANKTFNKIYWGNMDLVDAICEGKIRGDRDSGGMSTRSIRSALDSDSTMVICRVIFAEFRDNSH